MAIFRRSHTSSILTSFGEDLSVSTLDVQAVFGREKDREAVHKLFEHGALRVLLVGPEGVGKTVIMRTTRLESKRPHIFHVGAWAATLFPRDAVSHLDELKVAVNDSKHLFLLLPDIHQLFHVFRDAEIMNSFIFEFSQMLAISRVCCLATATTYSNHFDIERSPLGTLFERVVVEETDPIVTVAILEERRAQIERETGAQFSHERMKEAVALSDRYIFESYLPNKAIELMRAAAFHAVATRGAGAQVQRDDLLLPVCEMTGLTLL